MLKKNLAPIAAKQEVPIATASPPITGSHTFFEAPGFVMKEAFWLAGNCINNVLPASLCFHKEHSIVKIFKDFVHNAEKNLIKFGMLSVSVNFAPITFIATLLVSVTLSQHFIFNKVVSLLRELVVVKWLEGYFDKLSLPHRLITGVALIGMTHLGFAFSACIPEYGALINPALTTIGGLFTGNWYANVGLRKIEDYSVGEFEIAFSKMPPEKVTAIIEPMQINTLATKSVDEMKELFSKMKPSHVRVIGKAAAAMQRDEFDDDDDEPDGPIVHHFVLENLAKQPLTEIKALFAKMSPHRRQALRDAAALDPPPDTPLDSPTLSDPLSEDLAPKKQRGWKKLFCCFKKKEIDDPDA